MKFKLNEDGDMKLVTQNILEEMRSSFPISTAYIVDIPLMMESMKTKGNNILKNSNYALAPMAVGSKGIFWKAFLMYIFPWMLDIAKVFCLIKIAQAFYQEKRGGRDDGSGFGSLVTWGKWYLAFWLMPLGVELVDEIGSTMFHDLQNTPIQSLKAK